MGADRDYPDEETPEALSTFDLANYRHAHQARRNPDKAAPFLALAKTRRSSKDAVAALLAINKHPDLLLDRVHVVPHLPTSDPRDLLAALPHGYFADE